MSEVFHIKCVAVGDGAVGKTCMLMSYTKNVFPEEYIPTVFDNSETLLVVEGKTVDIELWDTAGQEEYDRLRSLSYADTEVFLVCFAVSDVNSFQNVENKWLPEIAQYVQNVPIVLVGTKSDLRENPPPDTPLVSKEAVEQVVKRNHLTAYVECSARTQTNLSAVFETASRAALAKKNPTPPKESGGCCTVL